MKALNNIKYLLKKFKFFYFFVLIGFCSIILELLTYNFFNFLGINKNLSDLLALLVGIFFAFYLNFFYNFKIHKSKFKRALILFFIISCFSWVFQKIISYYFIVDNISYEFTRIITSGCFFIIGYLLHRKFSFRDFKKVGIAFYLNKSLNLRKVFKKIGNNLDFIHIDLVDNSFSKNKVKNDIAILKKIKKLWPDHVIQTHVMSKKPTKWIKEVIEYSDILYIHWEIKENLNDIRKLVLSHGKKFGIAVTLKTPPKKILKILKKSTNLLILSIDDPGFSGQRFNFKAFDYVDFFNNLNFRNKFRICVDGGVDKNIIKILNTDDVVSNSAILGSDNPVDEIARFQSTKYNG
tara:strand:+ start:506 stop:1555 length:1050 start_codon:yes stop_codon:yes gene_type:complete